MVPSLGHVADVSVNIRSHWVIAEVEQEQTLLIDLGFPTHKHLSLLLLSSRAEHVAAHLQPAVSTALPYDFDRFLEIVR
jgi:hypothetical protein